MYNVKLKLWHLKFNSCWYGRYVDKKLRYRRGTARWLHRVSWNLANCHATVQKLLIRQVLHKPVMKLEGYSATVCNKHVHSTMTRSSCFHCPAGVINKPTTGELWISPVYRVTDDLLWWNFLSPQCRNCLRDPDHAHLGNIRRAVY